MMDLKPRQLRDTPCYTLPNFQELFIDSCLIVLKDNANVNETCQNAWEKFSGGFAFKDPMMVKLDDYKAYFDLLEIKSKPNSVVFWSGVLNLIIEVSKTTKIPISSSFTQPASSIINNMAVYPNCWCGNDSGVDYINPCPSMPSTSFWAELSSLLGKSASGVSFWVGNGEREGGAFRNPSFFSEYELANLSPDDTKLVVLDIHRMGMGEVCSNGSLAELQNLATEKFGEDGYTCYDVYGNVANLTMLMELSDDVLDIIAEEQSKGLLLVCVITLC